jgi:hypothetical protein
LPSRRAVSPGEPLRKFRRSRILLALFFALPLLAWGAAPLRIVEPGLHQTEDGALITPDTTFQPGEVIFFSCRLDGFQVSKDKKVAIQYEVTAVDPKGIPIIEPAGGKVDVELAPEDKQWKPKIRQTVLVPPLADSGTYKVHVSAKDTLSGAEASFEAPFEVRGRAVEPSDTLVVRNFQFYRTEDDPKPLAVAAYRPGDPVWARFDITGYKLGGGNKRDVAYTVTVTGEGGRVLLAPGEPSADQGSSFYPTRYVPCTISFNLQKTIRPGEYTVMIRTEDRVGGQSAEWKQAFRVE